MSDAVKKAEGEYIEIKVEDFKKLLLCARKCKDDFWHMRRVLEMNSDKNAVTECIHRMAFREPIFKVLEKFKGVSCE